MQRYAGIDIGTNSMRLLLAELKDGKFLSRTKETITSRIGEAVDRKGIITPGGMERSIESFEALAHKAKEFRAIKTFAIATSALRDAENREEFIQGVFERTGVKIQVIDGKREAGLGYRGVLLGLESPKKAQLKTLLVDVGGGSTEFILGLGEKLDRLTSMDIGAVRMTDRLGENDRELYYTVEKSFKNILSDLKNKEIDQLIGIGGSITSLAAIHQKLQVYDMEKVHNYILSLEQIHKIKQNLLGMTLEERKQVRGLNPNRADIIIAGIIILLVIMEGLAIDKITVSEYDNLEGLIYEEIQ